MIAPEDVVLVLLAAGRSVRFGEGASKLDQPVNGRPLGLHVADAMATIPFRERLAVTGRSTIDYAAHGFRVVRNPAPEYGMAGSVQLGVGEAARTDAAAVLIALADMPCVSADLVRRLLAVAEGPDAVVAASDGHGAKPPALFGRARFAALAMLTGDQGARDLIRSGRHVAATPGELVDIDTPDDLRRLHA